MHKNKGFLIGGKMKKFIILTILFCGNLHAVGYDKYLHVTASSAIAGVTYAYTESYTVSLATCMAVGVAKELYDEYDYGGFDHQDLVADGVGCLIGTLISEQLSLYPVDNGLMINYKSQF